MAQWNFQLSVAQATQMFPAHGHCALQPNQTTYDANHAHAIVNGVVQPNPSDGHTHAFVQQAAGVFAPCHLAHSAQGMGGMRQGDCNCGRK